MATEARADIQICPIITAGQRQTVKCVKSRCALWGVVRWEPKYSTADIEEAVKASREMYKPIFGCTLGKSLPYVTGCV